MDLTNICCIVHYPSKAGEETNVLRFTKKRWSSVQAYAEEYSKCGFDEELSIINTNKVAFKLEYAAIKQKAAIMVAHG